MAETKDLFTRLKKMFSTDVIVRNVGGKKLKIIDTDELQYATDRNSLRDRYNRLRSSTYNLHNRDMSMAYQAARLELFRDYDVMDCDPILACLSGDMRVATLDGFKTIRDLAETNSDGKSFEVWSWDKENCKYTIGQAHHPRKTGTKKVIELHFDNATMLKCTPDHRILLTDGTYKQAQDIQSGESVMPFSFKKKEYMMVRSKSGKYKKVHRYIYEDVFDKNIDNRAIHHINHNKYDNRTINLQEMSIEEHAKYHGKSEVTSNRKKNGWTAETRERHGENVKNRHQDEEYQKQFSRVMQETMSDPNLRKKISDSMKLVWNTDDEYREKALKGWRDWQNSDEGKNFMSVHTSKMNTKRWEEDIEYREKMTKIFSNHAQDLWKTEGFREKFVKAKEDNLRLKIANDSEYTKRLYGKPAEKNSNFNHQITNESILLMGQRFDSLKSFANSIELEKTKNKAQFLTRRLRSMGFDSFSDYKEKYRYTNHKLVKTVDNGEVTDVYDLTVDFFENFCLENGTIVSNSALDIYADECVSAETIIPLLDGRKVTIGDLHKFEEKNFWVYSIDSSGKFFPQLCERVAYNGDKPMLRLTLSDGTSIKCTSNHIWVLSNGEQIETSKLSVGSKIKNDRPSNEHHVISIEECGTLGAFDLVNVGDSHIYAIEANDGSKIFTHNCLVPSEFGNVLTIHSSNENIKKILENLFYDILNIEFNLWSWTRNMPVKYDSYIPMLSGNNITIEELSKKLKSGEEVWVYSVQDGTNKIVPGKVTWCDKNYTADKITKIVLDDNSIIETAPDHPFILRNGDTKRADELKENDSLMPFYRKLSPKKGGMSEYEMVYDPKTDKHGFTHRLVAESCGIKTDKIKRVLHHENFNKYDNSPTNLTPMEFFAHRKLHAEQCKRVLHSPKVIEKRMAGIDRYLRSDSRRQRLSKEMKGKPVLDFIKYNNSDLHVSHNGIRSKNKIEMWKDPVRRERAKNNMKPKWSQLMEDIYEEVKSNNGIPISIPDAYEKLKIHSEFMSEWKKHNNRKFQRIPRADMSPFVVSNHKVKSVETVSETADVYCMTVVGPNGEDDRHNFAICGKDANGNMCKDSGVFVKNCKYGDFFLRMEISPEYGVFLVQPISPYELTRVEGSDPNNINYVKFQHDGLGGGMEYESFEIAHFRLISDSNYIPYGKSMIEPARRVWKQLSLMEDAMLIHRIMRAPEKRIFKIDVGNIPPSEIDTAMQKVISQIKKVPYIDERTGDYNLRFNLNNMVEDFILPVRGSDSGTSIDTLPGMEFTGIDDLEYIKNKMMAALKIPKAFLGYEEGISGKATLAAEDVRFSRTIGRIQKILISELTKIAIVHLYVQGYQDASLVDFELELSNPSTIFEQEKIEIWQNKMNVAKDMMESDLFSRKWIYDKVFKIADDEIEDMEAEVIKDKKEVWRRQQITDEGNDPMTSNQKAGEEGMTDMPVDSGGGDLGGGVGDLPDLGGEAELPPDLPPLEEKKEGDQPLEEKKERERDQTGNKEKYSDTFTKTRGEDILGDMAAKEKSKSDRSIRHKYRGSAISMQEDLVSIKKTLASRYDRLKKGVITEKKSLLDEDNLISDDKPI